MPVVALEGVSKTYSMGQEATEVHALRDVSLLNIIGTLDRPTAGHYRLDVNDRKDP